MTSPNVPPMRVFIVEDHLDTLECFSVYLQSLGHTVFSASSVQEALREIPKSSCDILISDIGLPDATGWDLLRSLPLPRPPYAVAMSGFGMSADREKSAEAGFRHHLLKPVSPSVLDGLLAEAAAEIPTA